MSVVIKPTALIGALALISKVSAHGTVQGIVAGGKWYSGYSPSFQYQNPPPVVAGWSTPENIDNGFVSDYTSPDIICHKGATPGGAYVTVAAGDTVGLQWTVWPESHHGPMLDYLASCGDDCTTVDKTQLEFNKIDEAGLVDGSSPPGTWASDQMIANNNSWVVTIPSSIAPGKYVLRHETIALHSAFDVGGAQNYPQCINLEITGSGTTSLSGGTVGTSLYDAHDPGLFINIYTAISSYIIPGPALWDGASSGTTQPSGSASASASTSASASATSSSSSIAATTAPFSTSTGTGTGTSTSTSTVVTITRRPSKHNHVAVISSSTADAATTSAAVATTSSSVAVAPAETETETECSSEPIETPSAPASFSSMVAVTSDAVAVAAAVTTAPTSTPSTGTSPVSFTSTITGRIGQSTKFVCYLVD